MKRILGIALIATMTTFSSFAMADDYAQAMFSVEKIEKVNEQFCQITVDEDSFDFGMFSGMNMVAEDFLYADNNGKALVAMKDCREIFVDARIATQDLKRTYKNGKTQFILEDFFIINK